jgi:hypothetical protein
MGKSEMRKKIELDMSVKDIVVEMSEGNPGAINVMMSMIEKLGITTATLDILRMEDMNIRGSQIWVGYKDFAGGDMEKFVGALRDRNKEMISLINENSGVQELAPPSKRF